MGGERTDLYGRVETGTDLAPLVKAHFVGEKEGPQSTAIAEQGDELTPSFEKSGAIRPPYDPMMLALIFENSSALRPNVDSYVTNIDSYGHRFKPSIDLDASDADEKIRGAMRAERSYLKKSGAAAADLEAIHKADDPSDAEVKARKGELRLEMVDEKSRLELFFDDCGLDLSFGGCEGLRGLTRQDIEVTGNAFWEVLRDESGRVHGFNRVPSVTMRLLPLDKVVVDVGVERRTSILSSAKTAVKKRFRKFVQMDERSGATVFFKEFGDPRVMSAKTGTIHEEELPADDFAATEIIHFKISSPRTAYGIPRWVGTLLAVLGTRQSEEVNFLYFENRSIPPLAVLVSGGRLNADTVQRLEDYIGNQIRGKRNFHKILILEAEGAQGGTAATGEPDSGRMRIQLVPLTEAQQSDALFQNYDERNADKVGQSFRLPRLLRGDVRDFNRSTAEASVDFAEIQVFGPIRQQFDWQINHMVLPELGIKYHTFESNAPTVRDPVGLTDMIHKAVTANVLTPEEARELAEGVFNRPFLKIDAPWTKQPIALTIAGRQIEDDLHTPDVDEATRYRDDGIAAFNAAGGMSADGAGATQQSLGVGKRLSPQAAAEALHKLHKAMIAGEHREFESEVVQVPTDLFHSWFSKPDAG